MLYVLQAILLGALSPVLPHAPQTILGMAMLLKANNAIDTKFLPLIPFTFTVLFANSDVATHVLFDSLQTIRYTLFISGLCLEI
ncbi:hypothetical protein BC2230_190018 [Burkholderia cepacia]